MLSVVKAYFVCQVKVYGKDPVFAKYNLSGMKKKGRQTLRSVAFSLLSSSCRQLTDMFPVFPPRRKNPDSFLLKRRQDCPQHLRLQLPRCRFSSDCPERDAASREGPADSCHASKTSH